jgi:tRNA A-37 threonylcarbamoyl transferase component Bud32
MISLKNTERSSVRLDFDGSVFKSYRGPKARSRMQNEIELLQFLESKTCDFVPKLLSADFSRLEIVQSNCGQAVQYLTQCRLAELFARLREYGVEHGDPELRNVTYRTYDGVFCIVDFEFATILDPSPFDQLDWIARVVANELE